MHRKAFLLLAWLLLLAAVSCVPVGWRVPEALLQEANKFTSPLARPGPFPIELELESTQRESTHVQRDRNCRDVRPLGASRGVPDAIFLLGLQSTNFGKPMGELSAVRRVRPSPLGLVREKVSLLSRWCR